ncbi:hypothetical protein NBRC10513_006335 [Rhodotorula toruloides]|uniref:MYND-type domain-containing protein n=1 Tax=Rhodotorula toruloides TaxID=5286 RepID=A0A2T0A313_RHOTO|nr:hypothetical protein AAT19DRAFT_16314 [Rhodotorula toruloides]
MSLPKTGMCLVCGTETRNRCSSCSKAGLDLFFCSPEHQKFVWPVHRYFCGPGKANSWIWPALSPNEVEAALEILHTSLGPYTDGRWNTKTLAEGLKAMSGGIEQPDAILKGYVEPVNEPDAIDSAIAYMTRHFHHALLHSFEPPSTKPSPDMSPLLTITDIANPLEISVDAGGWRTPFLHQVSVIAAGLHSRAPPPDYNDKLRQHVLPSLVKLLQATLLPEDSEKARDTLLRLIQFAEERLNLTL